MNQLQTSLGFQLILKDNVWEIDLTHLRIFTGLSVLARIIGDQVIDHVDNSTGDVSFIYKINMNINPELLEMQVNYIQIYAKSGVLDNIILYKDEFHDHLRSVFGTFQRPIWGSKIHPEFYGEDSRKVSPLPLVFPFHRVSETEEVDYQFILERGENQKNPGKFFFRLTIESPDDSSVKNNSKPHLVVDDLKTRVYIAGSTKMAESLGEKIQSGCKKGMESYSEENLVYGHLFEQLGKTKIGEIDLINFYWEKEFSNFILNTNRYDRLVVFKRLFLSLEDNVICDHLELGETIQIKLGKFKINVYLTRLSRVLNFSINLERKHIGLDYYLHRMPILEQIAKKENSKLDFSNTRIFLIHHITSEILALIEVFRKLNVDEQNIMFVKYGGIVPSAYLDVLLEINDKNFFTAGLVRTVSADKKEYYLLSKAYSDSESYDKLNDYLEKKELNFFEAMKFISSHYFIQFCIRAYNENKKVLLIEDGGYLAPLCNDFALKDATIESVFKEYLIDYKISDIQNFSDFLKKVLIGSIEHTRNGYDRLKAVEKSHNGLFLTTYSIAISKNKVIEESKEVAHSILSAVESILHGQGMVLSRRKSMVLGAKGNIGSYLCKYLQEGRLHDTNKELLKVDLKFTDNTRDEYKALADTQENKLLDIELFFGVIGESILKKEFIEKIIIHGNPSRLIFASGSTKTVEFSDLTSFLNDLFKMENPKILNIPVEIEYGRILDPQSLIDQGGKVKISFTLGDKRKEKTLFLTGDLSPINFLFYGVPTETMDMIISQLTSAGLGMVDQYKNNLLPKPGVYAIDHEIDQWGNKI
jgi:hypothetical protein